MAFDKLEFKKSWESAEDFPTFEQDEAQVRKDMQALHDETKDYLNEKLLPQMEEELGKKANDDNVLHKDETEDYTPTQDTHPANKKYVDDVAKQMAAGTLPDQSVTPVKMAPEFWEQVHKKDEVANLLKCRAQIVFGSYVGTGTYGEDNPCTLEFDSKPLFVMVYEKSMGSLSGDDDDSYEAGYLIMAPYGATSARRLTKIARFAYSRVTDTFTWGDTTFSWYSAANTTEMDGTGQLNAEGTTYYYLAFLQEG